MRKFDLQLRALRTKKGLTLTELAEKIGSNYQAVGRWERGNAARYFTTCATRSRRLPFVQPTQRRHKTFSDTLVST